MHTMTHKKLTRSVELNKSTAKKYVNLSFQVNKNCVIDDTKTYKLWDTI